MPVLFRVLQGEFKMTPLPQPNPVYTVQLKTFYFTLVFFITLFRSALGLLGFVWSADSLALVES